ncbi:MAG: hypothetical protein IT377_11005 [Polyangiaceae bacterium]|nr:hypothetical protein [Polyangiaceae bacterium]
MKRAAIAAALLLLACRDGDPRGDDAMVGAWARVDDPARTPLYFHISGALDDEELGVFPGSPRGWTRAKQGHLWIWNGPTPLVVDAHEVGASRVRLEWSGGNVELERVPYAAPVCP